MNWLDVRIGSARRRIGWVALAAVLAATQSAPLAAQEGLDEAAAEDQVDPDELVVPPGQESLLAEMLGQGAPLPGGCVLTGGTADGPNIEATYRCRDGEVVLELAHSSQAEPSEKPTQRFVVAVLKGTAPDGLVDAVSWLVRGGEDGFRWTRLADTAPGRDETEEE